MMIKSKFVQKEESKIENMQNDNGFYINRHQRPQQ